MNVNNQRGFTVIQLLVVMVFLIGIVPWVWNGVKLLRCDFESDYKCEVIHGVGVVIPPTSLITVWFGDDGA